MSRLRLVLLLLPVAAMLAQTPPAGTIQASGSATLNVNPDQVQLTVGVTTQATTADAASQQNSTRTTAVIDALKALLGTTGTIQTVGYSVSPNYDATRSQTITGYTVTNTLQMTTGDLSLPGRLIDAASQAGATNIGGLSFGLRDPEPVRQQALSQASKQGLAHAGAIAAGLGAKTGAVVSAQEAASVVPFAATMGAAATTPILTGTVSVSANVTVTVQLVQ